MPETYTIETVPTPALVIDLAIVERNLTRMADYANSHGLLLRPHTKTHKLKRFARRQLELGAVGLTVAKAGEAEVLADGCYDLLIAYPALDTARIARIASLAHGRTVRVAVDSSLAADRLAQAAAAQGVTLGILVDIDTGYHRTGVQSPEEAQSLAELIDRTPGIHFDGLFTFPGHFMEPLADEAASLREFDAILSHTRQRLDETGLPCGIISGGSTPTAYHSHLVESYTEIRPGTYIYNDRNCVVAGWSSLDQCAARVVATVVSTAVPSKVVIDAGSKALGSDRCVYSQPGYALVIDHPHALVTRLTEEHGEVDITDCDLSPDLGSRLHVIPNHICPCVNLYDTVYLQHADGRLEPVPVDARGKLS